MPLVLSGSQGLSSNGTNFVPLPNANGYQTNPNQVYVYARCTTQAAFTLVTGGTHIIQYNSAPVNIGNCWNTSSFRFTAPVAGRYFCFAHGQINGSNTTSWGYNMGIWRNGVIQDGVYITAPGWSYQRFDVTGIVNCAAGDFIDFRLIMNVSNGSIEYTSADQRFAAHIHLLS